MQNEQCVCDDSIKAAITEILGVHVCVRPGVFVCFACVYVRA